MALGPMVLYSLAALGPEIVSDLDLSRTELGALSSAAFLVATATSMVSGRLVDRFGGQWGLVVLSAVSGVSMLLVALGSSYAGLVAAAAFSGIAVSLGNPVTNNLISVHAPAGRQGAIVGIKQSGVPLGQLLVGIVAPLVAVAISWRFAVGVLSILPLLNIALCVLFVPTSASDRPRKKHRDEDRGVLPPGVWWLMAYSFLMGAPVQATNTYLPLFGHEKLGFAAATAGLSITVAGAVGLVARIAWGGYSDRLRAPQVLLVALALGACAGSFFLVMVDATQWRSFYWTAAVLHGGAAIAAQAVAAVTLLRTIPAPSVGRATGVLALGQFGGFMIGPLAVGLVVDASGSYMAAWVVAALLYAAAVVVSLRLARTARTDLAPPTQHGTHRGRVDHPSADDDGRRSRS
jgi:nitrate/nitrite transporter NarK